MFDGKQLLQSGQSGLYLPKTICGKFDSLLCEFAFNACYNRGFSF